MSNKPIVSILNLKNGVGCSTLAWNIAHTLELDIFQHDKALHSYFLSNRLNSVENGFLFANKITVKNINKRKFDLGIYDIGSDFNYPYIGQLIKQSDIVIVPVENSHEVLLKSIATIKHVLRTNPEVKVFVVFNRLDNSDSDRERNYTQVAEDFIKQHIEEESIQFFYIRYSFAMLKNQAEGYYYLDNFIYQEKKFKAISAFNLLRNLRWYSINKMLGSKRKEKAILEQEKTEFFAKHRKFYEEYMQDTDISLKVWLWILDSNQ